MQSDSLGDSEPGARDMARRRRAILERAHAAARAHHLARRRERKGRERMRRRLSEAAGRHARAKGLTE